MLPFCCPDLKTWSRIQKIILRAKNSLQNLTGSSKPVQQDSENSFLLQSDDDDELKGIVKKAKNKKPSRTRCQKSKPERKIEIPICSDTSMTICITTDECESETDDQNGYISQEMDAALLRSKKGKGTPNKNCDVKDRYSDVSRGLGQKHPPGPRRLEAVPKLHEPKKDEAVDDKKAELYNKLISEWKYRKVSSGDLGAPPPPRHHKGGRNSFPF